MKFQIDQKTYDDDSLPWIDAGNFGDIYDIGENAVAKIYENLPDETQTQRLIRLRDSGISLASDPELSRCLALPMNLATELQSGDVVGFSMPFLSFHKPGEETKSWPKINALAFDIRTNSYKSVAGHQLTDEIAVKIIFTLFQLLKALEKRRMVIGDVSASNILCDPVTYTPALIDLDNSYIDGLEAASWGTPDYLDPLVLERGENSVGGFRFSVDSDVFAMTVVAFHLFTGIRPLTVPTDPNLSAEECALKRINCFRIAETGYHILQKHQLKLVDDTHIRIVHERLATLKRVAGVSGQDGQMLYDHFTRIFVNDERFNVIDFVSPSDPRYPDLPTVEKNGTKKIVDELTGILRAMQVKSVKLRNENWVEKDPPGFGSYLRTRGIDFDAMLST